MVRFNKPIIKEFLKPNIVEKDKLEISKKMTLNI